MAAIAAGHNHKHMAVEVSLSMTAQRVNRTLTEHYQFISCLVLIFRS
jgi:hypothetical protein